MQITHKSSALNYQIITERCQNAEFGSFLSYGIKVIDSKNTIVLHDVSSSKEVVLKMIKIFNKHQLNPTHLRDVVDDMLAGGAFL